jgi:uracil-xanthine permease
MTDAPDQVDTILPARQLLAFGLQHMLVMAASPITAAFVISRALDLPADVTVNLISATFLVCGLGTLLQSLGIWKIGARLPFVMVPGGAPVFIFISIAKLADIQTAVGSVIIGSVFYAAALPLFARVLKYFPDLVIGAMLVLVGINLVAVYGGVITGRPGTPSFGEPASIGLAMATILAIVVFARVLPGKLGQLAVMFGLVTGSIVAGFMSVFHLDGVFESPVLGLPALFPFGWPKFSLTASIPMLVFCVISMAEATSQTVAITEVVGRTVNRRRDVPRTISGDALMSFIGGCFGTSLIITSGENVGIVRATGVRSRYVTATCGVLLLIAAVIVPLGRLANAIPGSVIGGAAIIVFSIICGIGIDMLRRVDLHAQGNLFTLAVALAVGLLPILVPGLYGRFPPTLQIILGNGLAMGTVAAVLFNILFNHLTIGGEVAPARTETIGG